jgi:hypothetical protein
MLKTFLPIILLLTTNAFSISVSIAGKVAKYAPVTYYYKCGYGYQCLKYGTANVEDIEKSIEQNSGALFKSTASWKTSPVSFTVTPEITKYIASITFNEESTADGGSDGQLTLQETVNALYSTFVATRSMPTSLTVDGSAQITVTAKSEACY